MKSMDEVEPAGPRESVEPTEMPPPAAPNDEDGPVLEDRPVLDAEPMHEAAVYDTTVDPSVENDAHSLHRQAGR